jgi:hypothetical protein
MANGRRPADRAHVGKASRLTLEFGNFPDPLYG